MYLRGKVVYKIFGFFETSLFSFYNRSLNQYSQSTTHISKVNIYNLLNNGGGEKALNVYNVGQWLEEIDNALTSWFIGIGYVLPLTTIAFFGVCFIAFVYILAVKVKAYTRE